MFTLQIIEWFAIQQILVMSLKIQFNIFYNAFLRRKIRGSIRYNFIREKLFYIFFLSHDDRFSECVAHQGNQDTIRGRGGREEVSSSYHLKACASSFRYPHRDDRRALNLMNLPRIRGYRGRAWIIRRNAFRGTPRV